MSASHEKDDLDIEKYSSKEEELQENEPVPVDPAAEAR